MTPIIGPNPENRDEWLAARQKVITSTTIARIMRGEGWTVFHELRGDIEAFGGNRATRRGNRFQRATLEEYAEETSTLPLDGLPLLMDSSCPSLAATPDAMVICGDAVEPVAIYKTSPDGRVSAVRDPETILPYFGGRSYGVEIKTSLSPKVANELSEGDETNDMGVSEDWMWQIQSQCAVAGWEFVDVAILLFGRLKVRRVHRNATLIDVCRQTAAEYADRVARNIEPPFDPTASANQDAVRDIYGPKPGTVIDLSAEAAAVWERRAAAAARESEAKKEKDAADAEMRAIFADAEIGKLPDGGIVKLTRVHCEPYMVAEKNYTRFFYSKPKVKK